MGLHNAEIYTNMGMCCFYAQHYDMALNCFQRALELASDDVQAEVWYNVGQVALVSGYGAEGLCSCTSGLKWD